MIHVILYYCQETDLQTTQQVLHPQQQRLSGRATASMVCVWRETPSSSVGEVLTTGLRVPTTTNYTAAPSLFSAHLLLYQACLVHM